MGVYNLTNGADQPFYNVLADDGSCRYASQGMRRELAFSLVEPRVIQFFLDLVIRRKNFHRSLRDPIDPEEMYWLYL